MKDFTTIDTSSLAAVSGGAYQRVLYSHEPQTDTNGAIVGGEPFWRFNNYACNGAICGGERIRFHRPGPLF
jgi:hypothetical protein